MKLVLTAALCLIPALSFAGEKPTEEPTLAKPAVAVDQEVVEEVAKASKSVKGKVTKTVKKDD